MRRLTPHQPRSAFTLIELLVVIAIISVLLAALVFAVRGFTQTANIRATEALISTVNGQLQKRLEAFDRYTRTTQFKTNVTNFASTQGLPVPEATVIYTKILYQFYFPQRLSDLNVAAMFGTAVPEATGLSATDVTTLSSLSAETESAAMLYYTLTKHAQIGAETVGEGDFKNGKEITDTDNDGLLEFIDAWGKPLRFYRAPTRMIREVSTSNPQGRIRVSSPTTPPITGSYKLASTQMRNLPAQGSTYTDSADSVVCLTNTAVDDDPQDPTGMISSTLANAAVFNFLNNNFSLGLTAGSPTASDVAQAFALAFHDLNTFHQPLIISSGPDADRLTDSNAAFGLLSPSDNTSTQGRLGTPSSSTDGLNDNITNRNR